MTHWSVRWQYFLQSLPACPDCGDNSCSHSSNQWIPDEVEEFIVSVCLSLPSVTLRFWAAACPSIIGRAHHKDVTLVLRQVLCEIWIGFWQIRVLDTQCSNTCSHFSVRDPWRLFLNTFSHNNYLSSLSFDRYSQLQMQCPEHCVWLPL